MSKKIVPSCLFGALAQDFDGTLMAFEQWRHDGGHERLVPEFRPERLVGQ